MRDPRALSAGSPGQEEILVRRFQAGSLDAFDDLYRLHHRRVAWVASRHLSDPRDIEEAVQDTFTKAFRSLPRFNGQFRTGAWLGRIAVNAAIDIARKNQRRAEDPVGEGPEPAPTVGADAAIDQTMPAIDDTFRRLSPKHALALRMREIDRASHVEIAEAMGVTPSQAKALLHRARKRFRKEWRETAAGTALLLVAGGTSLWFRLSRLTVNATPAVSSVQTAAAGSAEAAALPLVGVADLVQIL